VAQCDPCRTVQEVPFVVRAAGAHGVAHENADILDGVAVLLIHFPVILHMVLALSLLVMS
jgi:hypothetical protein